ncbi:KamA family radical SAM protein, partial [Candidatus Pacearchaeota archaeon]|nr:KamA family radical SAM protein [Candidatus Pacearchaeota archaeon]
DSVKVLRNLLKKRSDKLSGFSVAKAIQDISLNQTRPDLTHGFFAELHYLLLGIQGLGPRKSLDDLYISRPPNLSGRQAAINRSNQLDVLSSEIDNRMMRFSCGLDEETIERRHQRRDKILRVFNATEKDWKNWRWQIKNVIRNVDQLTPLVTLTPGEKKAISLARKNKLPFGVTPYYLSLMDDEPNIRDYSIRAQVFPPMDYVVQVLSNKDSSSLDFMGEEDTSPTDLITRRYPSVIIFKPFNTCPQICVYCQRNWEYNDVMSKSAYAGNTKINAAIDWIKNHPHIHEVLITGGDPLAMGDDTFNSILKKVAAIPSVHRIRIGTRTIVTMPMRITSKLIGLMANLHEPGQREIAITTHVQHPYEITPEVMSASAEFSRCEIPIYNQLVYTYFISKRFEACSLRRRLRSIGINPYYTFNTKGKNETLSYRVPIARLLQEQAEEARLLPGIDRQDEAVFNVPRQGKNYLKSGDHRDLISILPDGARVYEFHPWERNIAESPNTYIYNDIPIYNYLNRLEKSQENIPEYETIWFYY